MRTIRKLIISFSIILGLLSCNNKTISDQTIEYKASVFINHADSSTIRTFKAWGFGRRGDAEIWIKKKGDRQVYSVFFFDNEDTTAIQVSRLREFKKDFTISMDCDTCRFRSIRFTKINAKVHIVATDTFGGDSVYFKPVDLKVLFPDNDPFKHFKRLSELKDTLGIIGSCYMPRIGEFIQFYLSSQYVLTYLPDTSLFDKGCKAIWMKEFSKGKTINKIWNLRKLDQPN